MTTRQCAGGLFRSQRYDSTRASHSSVLGGNGGTNENRDLVYYVARSTNLCGTAGATQTIRAGRFSVASRMIINSASISVGFLTNGILIVVLRKTIAIVLRARFGILFVDFNNIV